MSDPKRIPDIKKVAEIMPHGSALIYRHFGEGMCGDTAKALRKITYERDMQFLIGKDIELAQECSADGLHLPEIDLAFAPSIREHYPDWVLTVAAHSAQTLSGKLTTSLDAAILSPVFASESPSAGVPLGVETFSHMAADADIPVLALGGINDANVFDLENSGAAGIAGISGFVR